MEPTFQFTFLNEFPSRDTEVTSSLLLFQTCFPIIAHYVLLVADVMIGVVFTLGVLAVRIMNTNIYIFSNKHKPGKRPDLHPDVCLMEEYSHRNSWWNKLSVACQCLLDLNPTLLCSPPAARPGSVLHHDPPDALPRQTPRAAVGARHLLHASAQVPGAAQPSAVLEERRLLSAPVAGSTPRLRKSSRFCCFCLILN